MAQSRGTTGANPALRPDNHPRAAHARPAIRHEARHCPGHRLMLDAVWKRQPSEHADISHAFLRRRVTPRSLRFPAPRCRFGGRHGAGRTRRVWRLPDAGRRDGRAGLSRARFRFPQRQYLRLQPHILCLNGVKPPQQHARLMTHVAQLRLHLFECAAMVGVLPVRATRGFVHLLLQLRCDVAFAVDLQQGALFRHPQALLGPLCPFPLLREIARKPFPCLHEFAIARSQRRLDPRKGAVSTRPGSSRAATTDCCATVLCVSTSPRSFRGAETMSQLLLAPTPTVVPVGKSKGKRKTVNTVTLMTTAPHTRSGYRRSILPNFAKMLSMGI